jgi:hypothetical protein
MLVWLPVSPLLSLSLSVGACFLRRFAVVAYRKKLEQAKTEAAQHLQARIKAAIAFNAHTMMRVCMCVCVCVCETFVCLWVFYSFVYWNFLLAYFQ